jgi:hypothetical protein
MKRNLCKNCIYWGTIENLGKIEICCYEREEIVKSGDSPACHEFVMADNELIDKNCITGYAKPCQKI